MISTTKDVQSRGDLDRLSNTGVANWIRSKGANEPRAELLDIAKKAWDNPKKRLSLDLEFKQKVTPAKHRNKIKTPQTRPDLARINYRDLCAWIKSQGVPIPSEQRKKKQKVLALAERKWDAKENSTLDESKGKPAHSVDVQLVEQKDSTTKRAKRRSAPWTPQTRSDLARIHRNLLQS